MGYILPISQFEYTDYQKRVIKDKDDFQYIEKPYKITFDMHQQFNYDQNFANEMRRESKQGPSQGIKLSNPKKEQLISTITGKGSLFNESV